MITIDGSEIQVYLFNENKYAEKYPTGTQVTKAGLARYCFDLDDNNLITNDNFEVSNIQKTTYYLSFNLKLKNIALNVNPISLQYDSPFQGVLMGVRNYNYTNVPRTAPTETEITILQTDYWFYEVDPPMSIYLRLQSIPTPEPELEPNFTNNIENAEYNYTIENETITINLTTNDTQKRFTSNPTITYINANNETITENFNVSIANNITTATISLNINNIDLNENLILNGVFSNINIVNNIENVNFSYTLDNYNISFELSQQSAQYRFTTVPTLNGTEFNLIVENDNETANLTINNANFTDTFIINGVSERIIKTHNNLTYCTVQGLKDYYSANETINLTLIANDLYFFETAPTLELYPIFQSFNFNINNDLITANISINLSLLEVTENNIYLEGGAVPLTNYQKNYGGVNVYVVTNENLSDFAKTRFRLNVNNDSYVNLGQYIISAKKYLFDIGLKIPNLLNIANYETNINVNTPFYEFFTLDFGTITIPYKNNDIIDYDCELTLFLPFYGFVNLDNSVLNKPLKIVYNINIITNDCYIDLILNDIKINSYNCEPSNDILLMDKEFIYNDKFTSKSMDGLQPYVILKYYNSENCSLINNDNVRFELTNLTGFNVINEIKNLDVSNLTIDEQNLIVEKLENGIYF